MNSHFYEDFKILAYLKTIWGWLFVYENMSTADYFKIGLYQFLMYFIFTAIILAGLAETELMDVLDVSTIAYAGFEILLGYLPFFLQRKNYFVTVNELQDYYDLHKFNEVDRHIICSCQIHSDKVVKLYNILLWFCISFVLFLPVIIYFVHLCMGEAVLEAPSKAAFPWDLGNKTNLFISYTLEFPVGFLLCPLSLTNIATPIYFFMAIVSRFKISQERFKEIKTASNPEEAMILLVRATTSHQEALVLLNRVNMLGNMHYFVIIAVAVLGLSFSLFIIANTDVMSRKLMYTQICFSLALHTFLLCYYGQKVKSEIEMLCVDIYDVPWYNYSNAFRRCLLICLMQAQNTGNLMAWKYSEVSLETYMSVISTSFTYLTFLKTMAE